MHVIGFLVILHTLILNASGTRSEHDPTILITLCKMQRFIVNVVRVIVCNIIYKCITKHGHGYVLYVLLFFWVYAFKSPSLFLSHTNKHKDGTLYRLKRHNNLLPELHDYAHIFFRLRHSDTLHTAKPYSQNMNTYVSSNNRNNIRNTPT